MIPGVQPKVPQLSRGSGVRTCALGGGGAPGGAAAFGARRSWGAARSWGGGCGRTRSATPGTGGRRSGCGRGVTRGRQSKPGRPVAPHHGSTGTGTTAANGNIITVHYTGWLYDDSKADKKGLQFETSKGSTTFQFILGAGQVIAGWDRGVVGMNVGGSRRLILPPSMAYGANRASVIPPNATLVFDIEVVGVE